VLNIALVTCESLAQAQYAAPNIEAEDILLTRYLQEQGHHVESCIWSNPAVNWHSYDLVLLKSPWDYFDRVQEFYAWLDRIEQEGIRMLNPVAIVRWNADKQYLLDLERQGVRIAPTHWLPRGTNFEADTIFEALRTDRLVVKPAVSGGAKNTFDMNLTEAQRRAPELNALLQTENFLAQPFLPQIQSQGEWSLIYLGGQYSHCVLKTPKSGDFRVQHYLGGGIESREAPAHLRHIADDIVQRFAADCLYARVDGVEVNGEFLLMELELIEPFLYLDTAEGSFARYEAGVKDLAARFVV
jgi:glutathione synthase/RimK-type ligase-like ATP-grasp enzyme